MERLTQAQQEAVEAARDILRLHFDSHIIYVASTDDQMDSNFETFCHGRDSEVLYLSTAQYRTLMKELVDDKFGMK